MWGAVLCGTAMATVGTSVVASKLIGVQIEPFAATALRHLMALPALLLLCVIFRPAWPRPGRRDAWMLLVQAASGSVGYTALLIAGTSMASAADAGVVTGTLPAMAALLAIVLLGERPGMAALLGIALAMATLMSAGGLLLSLPAAALAWAMGSPRAGVAADPSGQWAALAAIAWYAWVPTVIGAAAVLGEALAPVQLMALGLVLAGVLIGAVRQA